jgi:hypothetical protein
VHVMCLKPLWAKFVFKNRSCHCEAFSIKNIRAKAVAIFRCVFKA